MTEEPPDEPLDEGDDVPSEGPSLGLDQLQAAGQEMIDAMRAVLDVAEDLLSDPRAAEAVSSALSSLEQITNRAAATGRRTTSGWMGGTSRAGADGDDDWDDNGDEDQGPGVQHIPVS